MTERREPGTYRTPEGGIEIIVDLAESTGYVRDMWPDEVAAIEAEARAAALDEARAAVDDVAAVMDWGDGLEFVPRGAALAAIDALREDGG